MPDSEVVRRLVIVESPAKARTIAGYLGSDWDVEASVGHIRDIPTPSEMPADIKKGPFGKFGVNIEDDFEPYYVVDADKKKKVAELKRLLKGADELYLATDEDREGEAIAWHLLETLQPTVPVKRMVFHEITKEAIQRAAATTRDLDTRLVDAQETRRILDRLYGYEVSPVLWRKVKAGLSAGRVQSVARKSSSAPLSRSFSLRICARLSAGTTYSGSKCSSTFTPRRAHGRPLYFAGISSAPLGRSRMWPKLDSTTYPDPRKPAIIRAFFGDSTITRRVPTFVPAAPATALPTLVLPTTPLLRRLFPRAQTDPTRGQSTADGNAFLNAP